MNQAEQFGRAIELAVYAPSHLDRRPGELLERLKRVGLDFSKLTSDDALKVRFDLVGHGCGCSTRLFV